MHEYESYCCCVVYFEGVAVVAILVHSRLVVVVDSSLFALPQIVLFVRFFDGDLQIDWRRRCSFSSYYFGVVIEIGYLVGCKFCVQVGEKFAPLVFVSFSEGEGLCSVSGGRSAG